MIIRALLFVFGLGMIGSGWDSGGPAGLAELVVGSMFFVGSFFR